MAAKKRALKKKTAKPQRKSSSASKPQTEKPTGIAAAKVPAEDALEQLREAASREIAENSVRIAGKLAEKAVNGNSTCTKVLVDLVKGGQQPKPKPSDSRSAPILIPLRNWATDPEWKGSDRPASQVDPGNH